MPGAYGFTPLTKGTQPSPSSRHSSQMALLGDDGRGFELARKLESYGVWRAWLGDSCYANFVHLLSSPSTWEAFMRPDESKPRAQIQLQLRARALLYDKACASLFLNPRNSSSSVTVSNLNPAYLQLHGDDVYFTLENSSQDGVQQREGGANSSKMQSKAGSGAASRYGDSEVETLCHRYRSDELPSIWYNQFIEMYKINKPIGDRDCEKRTPEEMAAYIRCVENHKKRRVAIKEDQFMGLGKPNQENPTNMHPNNSNSVDNDTSVFPEILFSNNCVPDSALPPPSRVEEKRKVEFHGVLDMLPQVMTRSPVMIERLGIRPEYLSMESGGSVYHGKICSEGNKKCLGQEQASKTSQKVVAHILTGMGFEAVNEVPLEVLAQLLSCHISKLGRTLKVLADSYRKQCSAIELLKMFLKTMDYSNYGPLMELVKDGSRNLVQQMPQVQGMQSQMQPQHQNSLRVPQQVPRQIHSQMQQIIHSQNMAFHQKQQQQQQQQQVERMRRRQPSTPRPAMDMDKERPMVQVKIENPSEFPLDGNAFNAMNARNQQMQFRQQQMAALSGLHSSSNQFRPMASLPSTQIQSPSPGTMGVVRAPPVKVEGFQELMGGDSSSKHESEENRLTSPASK